MVARGCTSPAGGTLNADAAVLAVGNLPPHNPPGLVPENLSPSLYFGDPWDGSVAERLGARRHGAGHRHRPHHDRYRPDARRARFRRANRRALTARAAAAPPCRSRRLGPDRTNAPPPLACRPCCATPAGAARRSAGAPRSTSCAPSLNRCGRNATGAQRQRFVRHLRPWWDIHRHRLAPQIADRIAALIAAKQP